ncbi:MAG TPA: L-lactate dehydrogenase [Firmicutes bacterium]|nr:L-lactate dehydrogenase [Bacillota bacterium]HBX25107.1 L-lactate dehydrogenase [Bacillota bacterium]
MINTRKVAIIGDGAVGSSIAYTLMLEDFVNEIALIDLNKDKALGDVLDMQDGLSFLKTLKVLKSGSYSLVKDSHVVIITAGVAQKEGETRLDLLKRNASIMASICDGIKPYLSKDSIVIVVSNPCDVLSYLCYKKLGLPSKQVFGSGTVLDTSRLKTLISKDTLIDSRNIHTFVIGEHGDSEVALFSSTIVGGLPLDEYCSKCGKCKNKSTNHFQKLAEEVKNAAYSIISKKGATNYAIALATSRIVSSILNDENSVLTVSTHIDNALNGLIKDVYMSFPCVVNGEGIKKIIHPNYSKEEMDGLLFSAKQIKEKIDTLNF